jgi:DNA-binding NtrC family response regulator
LNVTSEIGVGTTVCLVLPKALETSANFSNSLTLDDQESIRNAVSLKFHNAQNEGLKFKIFSNSKELESWITSHTSKFKLYSDYFLEHESETGLQIIKRLGVEDRAILFTSAHNHPNVIEAAKKVRVPILSKDEFLQSTIDINRSTENLII